MQTIVLHQEKTRPTYFSQTRFLLVEKYCIKLYHALTIASTAKNLLQRPLGGDYNHRLNYGMSPVLGETDICVKVIFPKSAFSLFFYVT